MKRTDTDIHSIELLLVLDYLLNNTDKEHPATQTNIARYSKKYGLKYDPINQKGNDIKRQRLGKYLELLKRISDKFSKEVSFHISKTESGKYYVDAKNYLNEKQINSALNSVLKNPDLSYEEKESIVEALLKIFGNNFNRRYLKEQASNQLVEKQKHSKRLIRNLKLLMKALKEDKTIMISSAVYETLECRVYKIKEFKHTPYVILLPINENKMFEVIFSKVALLTIPDMEEDKILHDDIDERRDLQKLFKQIRNVTTKKYNTLDDMLKEHKLIEGAMLTEASFYFDLNYADIVCEAYEYYFSEELNYKKSSLKEINIVIGETNKNADSEIKYGFVNNLRINGKVFESWLLSDPFDNGLACVCDFITLLKPRLTNRYLACHFARHLSLFKDYLSEDDKKSIIDDLNK